MTRLRRIGPLAALALACLSRPAPAFNGMSNGVVNSPFVVNDALGNTSSFPGGIHLRDSGAVPVAGVPRNITIAGGTYKIWGGYLQRLPTSTPTTTPTSSVTPTWTPTSTPTWSPTATRSRTPTATPTASPTGSPTATPSATSTASPTASPTATPSATRSASPTASPTATSSASRTVSTSPSPTRSASPTPSPTATRTPSASPSATRSATVTRSPTRTPSATATATLTPEFAAAGTGTGLCAQYFDDITLSHQVLNRVDANVDNDWGTGVADPAVGADDFSIRWTGDVEVPVTGTYTFYTLSDDGVRLWINGVPLIDNWTLHAATTDSGTVAGVLSAGTHVTITLEYYEHQVNAEIKLFYESGFLTKQIIPQARLYNSGCGLTATPTSSPSRTPSSTLTATRSVTQTLTPTQTPTVTVTTTFFPQLALLKSSLNSFVTIAGDQVTYVLNVQNTGTLDATAVDLWDTVDPDTTWLAGGTLSGGMVSFGPLLLVPGASQDFTFSVSYGGSGSVSNRFSADAANHPQVDSNVVLIGLGSAFTATATPTASTTQTPTASPSATPTPSPTESSASTDTASPTVTLSDTATPTETPYLGTATSTETLSATLSATPTISGTDSPTETPSITDTNTPTVTDTDSPTWTPTASPTDTPTVTDTDSPTATPSITGTNTPTVTGTDSPTATPSATDSDTPTVTPSASPTATPSATDSDTPTATPSATPTATPTASPSASPSATPTASPSASPSATRTPSPTATPSASLTPTPTLSPTASASPSMTPSATHTPSVTVTPSSTGTNSATPSTTQTQTPSATVTPTVTVTPTALVPQLSLSVSAPVNAYLQQDVAQSFSLSNDVSGGPALQVMIYDSVPAQFRYTGPGFLELSNYPANDKWKRTAYDNLVVRGPFTVSPGGVLSLELDATIQTLSGGTALQSAWVSAFALPAPVSAAASTSLLPGQAPSKTITQTFTDSPTALGTLTATRSSTASPSPSITVTSTKTPNGTFTISPTLTVTMTPVAQPTLIITMVVNTAANQIYVGKDVSIDITVSNLPGSPVAKFLELRADRDLPANARTGQVPGFNALQAPLNLLYYDPNVWYWHDDNHPQAQWVRIYKNNVLGGDSRSAQLVYRVLPSAAGLTLTSRIQLLVNSVPINLSAAVDVVVPLYTPTSNITDTPTITPTPIAKIGEIVAYPQPAKDKICFDYIAPAGNGGDFQMYVYNLAFQLVATVKDQGSSGGLQTTCVNIDGLAPGLYVYRARQGDFKFPPGRFGVLR